MIIRLVVVSLALVFVSACEDELPLAPDLCGIFEGGSVGETSTVYCGDVNITNPVNEDDKEVEEEIEEVEEVTITISHTNDEGRLIYSIGPGMTFRRVGGSSLSVWCKIGSNCNGSSRTQSNVVSPPSNWISYERAEFRQSGSIGNNVLFSVDGKSINHLF